MSEKNKSNKESDDDKSALKRFKVKVHRVGMDPENKDLPISVDTCNPATGGKLRFSPGTVVELTLTQIDILSRPQETNIPLDEGSGIYEASNPQKLAEKYYPGFSARRDPATGIIWITKSEPLYIVERVGGFTA